MIRLNHMVGLILQISEKFEDGVIMHRDVKNKQFAYFYEPQCTCMRMEAGAAGLLTC